MAAAKKQVSNKRYVLLYLEQNDWGEGFITEVEDYNSETFTSLDEAKAELASQLGEGWVIAEVILKNKVVNEVVPYNA